MLYPLAFPEKNRNVAGNSLLFSHQRIDLSFRLFIVSFPNVHVADDALFVEKVHDRPVLLVVCIPRFVLIVCDNGIFDAQPGNSVSYVSEIFFTLEFRGVNTNDLELGAGKLFMP